MFLLFAGECYNPMGPMGGYRDFQGAFETLEAAEIAAKEWDSDDRWAQIIRDPDGRLAQIVRDGKIARESE